MDKKALIPLFGIIIVIIAGYFVLTSISFDKVRAFGGFPIPKDAEVIKEEEGLIEYNWSKASERKWDPKKVPEGVRKGWMGNGMEGRVCNNV